MTQKQDILNFLVDHSPKAFTSKQLFKKLNIKKFPSLRGRVSELKKEEKIKSRKSKFLKRLEYFVPPKLISPFRRKIIKSLWYCPNDPHRAGFGHKVFALTYEDNDIDRFDELIEALQLGTDEIEQGLQDPIFGSETRGNKSFVNMKNCVQASEFGYDDEMETNKPPFEFPDIEVGEE